MRDIEFLRNIINNLCKQNPLIFEVGGLPNNVDVQFTTSVDTLHAWKKYLDAVVPNAIDQGRGAASCAESPGATGCAAGGEKILKKDLTSF